MKYNPPYGSADPNAPFADRNTPAATSGSRVPAAAIEYPQREIMAVIDAAGISASNADLTQLLQAINHLIAAATGGAGDPNYVLMTQARVRLPIFPEVQASDGIIPIISPGSGQVRVPAGYNFVHRGIFLVTTVQTDFVTSGSKTYHLRWTTDAGFVLKDLADATYNPGALPEGNASFDSTYDNMLVARVVTNASNVPTITNLVNKNRISADGSVTIQATPFGGSASTPVVLNWARRPMVATRATYAILDHNAANCEVDTGMDVVDRYSVVAFYRRTSSQGDGGVIQYQAWLG
jgi:hypothetical protein